MKTNYKIFSWMMMFCLMLAPLSSLAFDRYETGKGLAPDCNYNIVPEQKVTDENGVTKTVPAHFSDECNFNVLIDTINKIIDFVLFVLATPLFAIIVMYAGWLYLSDGGSESNVKKAKKILINALTGYVLALVAWILVKTIMDWLSFKGPMYLSLLTNLIS